MNAISEKVTKAREQMPQIIILKYHCAGYRGLQPSGHLVQLIQGGIIEDLGENADIIDLGWMTPESAFKSYPNAIDTFSHGRCATCNTAWQNDLQNLKAKLKKNS